MEWPKRSPPRPLGQVCACECTWGRTEPAPPAPCVVGGCGASRSCRLELRCPVQGAPATVAQCELRSAVSVVYGPDVTLR